MGSDDAGAGDCGDINVVCEECGRAAKFPRSQLDSVQDCPHCGAFVDVAVFSADDDESWGYGEQENEVDQEEDQME